MAHEGGVRIEYAKPEHVEAITKIAESWRLDRRSAEPARDEGFLVSGYVRADYERLLARAEHFYVALQGDHGRVVGYVIAYSDERVLPEEWVNTRLQDQLDDFVVIKQVAVDQGLTGQGVATRLYSHVLDRCRGTAVVAAVVDDPPNHASARFHRKLGFTELTVLTPPDDRLPRMIWHYLEPNIALLGGQYDAAVALYMHEDNLNWSKLRNFLYVTVMLAAAFGFVMTPGLTGEGELSTRHRVVGIGLSLIGSATAVGFAVTLSAGGRYLLQRKRGLAALEDALVRHGGVRLVSQLFRRASGNWLVKSPTSWVLRLAPMIGLLCWIGALVFVLAA